MVVESKNSEGNVVTVHEDTSVNIVTEEHGNVPMVVIVDTDKN
jgi:hypothetical protein